MAKKLKSGVIRVNPNQKIELKQVDPDATGDYKSKEVAREQIAVLQAKIADYQEKLYAEGKQSLLIVLQAMDTGGKDGALRNLLTGINPAGVQVTSFKVPSTIEMAHDFLWRVHAAAPAKGLIGVWNRSHYEEVLVARVHELVPEEVWKTRYETINHFEKLLSDSGTKILKFYLHISKDEQKARLQARLDDPAKHWKFNTGDLEERKKWDGYQAAYQDAVNKCSTPTAPWYVVPANHKWGRDIALAQSVAAALEEMNPKFPDIKFDPKKVVVK